MRAKTLTTPSDAPSPGIGWLVLPARDRIISQGERMGEGAFDLLKTGYSQLQRPKQRESGPTGLRTILSIRGLLSIELTLPVAGRLQPVPILKRRRGLTCGPTDPAKRPALRPLSHPTRRDIRRGAVKINSYDCLSLCLAKAVPIL